MNLQNLSFRKFLLILVTGAILTSVLPLILFYLLTGNEKIIICGIILTVVLFAWGAVLSHFLQRKLTDFTNNLCQTLNSMMDGNDKPPVDFEAETSLSRITHRMERLYNIMQKTRRQAAVSYVRHLPSDKDPHCKPENDQRYPPDPRHAGRAATEIIPGFHKPTG